jgi:hypothetical protein
MSTRYHYKYRTSATSLSKIHNCLLIIRPNKLGLVMIMMMMMMMMTTTMLSLVDARIQVEESIFDSSSYSFSSPSLRKTRRNADRGFTLSLSKSTATRHLHRHQHRLLVFSKILDDATLLALLLRENSHQFGVQQSSRVAKTVPSTRTVETITGIPTAVPPRNTTPPLLLSLSPPSPPPSHMTVHQQLRGGASIRPFLWAIQSRILQFNRFIGQDPKKCWMVLFTSILLDTSSTITMKRAQQHQSVLLLMTAFAGYFVRSVPNERTNERTNDMQSIL